MDRIAPDTYRQPRAAKAPPIDLGASVLRHTEVAEVTLSPLENHLLQLVQEQQPYEVYTDDEGVNTVSNMLVAESGRTERIKAAIAKRLRLVHGRGDLEPDDPETSTGQLVWEAVLNAQTDATIAAYQNGDEQAARNLTEEFMVSVGLARLGAKMTVDVVPHIQHSFREADLLDTEECSFDQRYFIKLAQAGLAEHIVKVVKDMHGIVFNLPSADIGTEHLIDTRAFRAGLGKEINLSSDKDLFSKIDEYPDYPIIPKTEPLVYGTRAAVLAAAIAGSMAYSDHPDAEAAKQRLRNIAYCFLDNIWDALDKGEMLSQFEVDSDGLIEMLQVVATAYPDIAHTLGQEFDAIKSARSIQSPYRINNHANATLDKALADIVAGRGKYGAATEELAFHMSFDSDDCMRLIESGQLEVVLDNLDMFVGLSEEDMRALYHAGLHAKRASVIWVKKDSFPEGVVDYEEIAEHLIANGNLQFLIDHIPSDVDVNKKQVYDKAIENKSYAFIFLNASYFPEEIINIEQIVDGLIEIGRSHIIFTEKHLGRDIGISLDKTYVYQALTQAGEYSIVIANAESFPEGVVDFTHVWEQALIHQPVRALGERQQKQLSGLPLSREVLLDCLRTNSQSFATLAEVYKLTSGEAIPSLDTYIELFGRSGTIIPFTELEDLYQGTKISDRFTELGVTTVGVKGIDQLRSITTELTVKFVNEDVETLQLAMSSDTALAIYANILRYKESGFGRRDNEYLRYIIQERIKSIRSFPESRRGRYQPSQEYSIAYQGEEDVVRQSWTEDESNRYKRLLRQMTDASLRVQEPHPFSSQVKILGRLVADELAELQAKQAEDIASGIAPKAATESRAVAIAELNEILGDDEGQSSLRSLKDFKSNFSVLSKYRSLHDELSTSLFMFAMRRPPQGFDAEAFEYLFARIADANRLEPTVDDVAFVVDQVDHVINKEALSHYFADKQLAKKFGRMSSTATLQQALVREQSGKVRTKKLPMSFVAEPADAIAAKLSGQIADACWADQYDMTDEFPNFTTVTIRLNPGQKTEKMGGAFLLIDSQDEVTNERLLIIRGLNPVQNVINRLDVAEFYQAVTDYVKDLAEKDGKRAAIVIDGASGMAATNRPVLFNFLRNQATVMKRAKPGRASTTFNGYRVDESTYLL